MSKRQASKIVIAPPGPLGVKVKPTREGKGLLVIAVDVKSPLVGKVSPADWIVSMDEQDVSSVSDLTAKKDEGRLLGIFTQRDQRKLRTSAKPMEIAPDPATNSPINLLEFVVEPRGASLGLLLDEQHVVQQVADGSPMEGKLLQNDQIYAVNGVGISTLDMTQLATYLTNLQESFEMVHLKIARDPTRNKTTQQVTSPRLLTISPPYTVPTTPTPRTLDGEQDLLTCESLSHNVLSPDESKVLNEKVLPELKEAFPVMSKYNIPLPAADAESTKLRKALLSELIAWNDVHKMKQEITIQNRSCSLSWVPTNAATAMSDDVPMEEFLNACRQSRRFDENVKSIVEHFSLDSFKHGVEMLMRYFAYLHPRVYNKVQVFLEQEMSRKRQQVTVAAGSEERRNKKYKTGDDETRNNKSPEGNPDWTTETTNDMGDGKADPKDQEPIVFPEDYQDFGKSLSIGDMDTPRKLLS